jgi:hypothetical protein
MLLESNWGGEDGGGLLGKKLNAPLGPRKASRLGYWKVSLGDLLTQRRSALPSPLPWQSNGDGHIGG